MLDDPFERRRAERCDTLNFLDYEILADDGETVGRGLARTLNISETGLLLETGQPFDPGQSLRITLALANELVQVIGQVVYSQPASDDLCTAGVHFIEFNQTEQQHFLRYFQALQKAAGP